MKLSDKLTLVFAFLLACLCFGMLHASLNYTEANVESQDATRKVFSICSIVFGAMCAIVMLYFWATYKKSKKCKLNLSKNVEEDDEDEDEDEQHEDEEEEDEQHEDDPIIFDENTEVYADFTNSARMAFTIDGNRWRTAEHYIQAKKFLPNHFNIYSQISKLRDPGDAIKVARQNVSKISPSWFTTQAEKTLREALYYKLKQNPKLTQVLKSTGDRELIYYSKDKYFGNGGRQNDGKNMLGKMLMRIRNKL